MSATATRLQSGMFSRAGVPARRPAAPRGAVRRVEDAGEGVTARAESRAVEVSPRVPGRVALVASRSVCADTWEPIGRRVRGARLRRAVRDGDRRPLLRLVPPLPEEAVGTSARVGVPGESVPTLRLTARGRWTFSVVAVVLALMVGLGGGRALAGGGSGAIVVERYTVARGDTLWALASERAASGQDIRDVILAVMDLNGLSQAGLVVGQELVLPLPSVG